MKRFFLISAIFCCAFIPAPAQDMEQAAGQPADSTGTARDVYSIMPDCVSIEQSQAIDSAFYRHIRQQSSKSTHTFRIRLFTGNSETDRNARKKSEDAESKFISLFPSQSVSREFDNPNYVVYTGGFKSRIAAERALNRIIVEFPDAMIVMKRSGNTRRK